MFSVVEIDVKDEDCRVLIGWLCMAIMIEMDGRRELERWDDKRQMHIYYLHLSCCKMVASFWYVCERWGRE